ncbi:MAG: hypothetical protein K6A69_10430 [Lachnospiraceae bacterium]|nr:hypothetical protein [Lachnospiraceae bacterium]
MSNLIISALTALVLSLSTLGTASQVETTPPSNILKEIIDHNSVESLVAKYGRFTTTYRFHFADGTVEDRIMYYSADRFGDIARDNTFIDDKGDVYGYMGKKNCMYHVLFVDDSYETYIQKNRLNNAYEYDDSEKILSFKEQDGLWVIETNMDVTSETAVNTLTSGIDPEMVDSFFTVYTVEPATLEILKVDSYIVRRGKKTLDTEIILNRNCDEYFPDPKIIDGVFGGDQCTCTVITDAGTPMEKAYTQTVAKGNCIVVYGGDNFSDKTIYLDPACTIKVEPYEILTKDVVYYLKR